MLFARRMVLAVCCLLLAAPVMAQLKAGDIALVEYNTDGEDEFAWVALCRLPANTVIRFTDSSVSNGCFRWTEHLGDVVSPGPLCWSHTNALEAGTVVRWRGAMVRQWTVGQSSGAWPNLNSDGDQLVAYSGVISNNPSLPAPWQGDAAGAVLLHAINFANSGWDNVTGGDPESSFVPPGLSVSGGTAVHVSRLDNACYRGIREGDAGSLLKAIADPAHWIATNDLTGVEGWGVWESFRVEPPGTVFSIR